VLGTPAAGARQQVQLRELGVRMRTARYADERLAIAGLGCAETSRPKGPGHRMGRSPRRTTAFSLRQLARSQTRYMPPGVYPEMMHWPQTPVDQA